MSNQNPYTAPSSDCEPHATKLSILRWFRNRAFLLFAVIFAIQAIPLIQGVLVIGQLPELARHRSGGVEEFFAFLLGPTSCLVGMVGTAVRNRRMVVAAWTALATVYGTLWSLWIIG